MLKAFARVGAAMAEDKLAGGQSTSSESSGATPDQKAARQLYSAKTPQLFRTKE
jgi:hypothetical protein